MSTQSIQTESSTVAFDLFGHIPKRKPKLPKVSGCAADLQDESSRRKFLERVSRIHEVEQLRVAVDGKRKSIKEMVAKMRSEKSTIKGRSKAAVAQRQLIKQAIEALRKEV